MSKYIDLAIDEIHKLLKIGEITPTTLVNECFERIENSSLNAFITVDKEKALKEAILNGVRNFKYIDKIIYDWSKKGTKTRAKEDNSNDELFDYDWLDDNE